MYKWQGSVRGESGSVVSSEPSSGLGGMWTCEGGGAGNIL